MTLVSTTSQPIMSLMPTMLEVPPNQFYPFQFGISHIPQPVPFIKSGYMPSTSYPIYSMPTHLVFLVFGGLFPQSGGYNLSHSFNP